MKCNLFVTFLFLCSASLATQAQNAPRQRTLVDDNWRFQVESTIEPPNGSNSLALNDWLIKESANGEADAEEMTSLKLDTSNGWVPAKTGDDITAAHKNKFVWYRMNLDPVLVAHPLHGPLSVFFVGAGAHAVIFLNGHKVTEHSANVHSLNASEILQTGAAAKGAATVGETDGVSDCFQACLEPWWNPKGPNLLAVMIRASSKQNNGIIGQTFLFSGFPAESQPDFNDASWRVVHLPHDYVVEGTFDPKYNNQRGALPVPRAWYRRNLDIPVSDEGKSIWIDFDGIYRDSQVWLNGHYLGNHPSGYTSFRYDITNDANYGGKNELAVLVDPRVAEGWWYEGGGIYRHVWLNVADQLHVVPWGTYITSEVKGITTDHPSAKLTVDTSVLNQSTADKSCQLRTTIVDPDDKPVAKVEESVVIKAGQRSQVRQSVSLPDARLWSCESPTLYHATTEIVRDHTVVDHDSTTFGVRSIRFDANHGFFLNEKRVEIYGTCNHLDFAGVGIAVPVNLQEWRLRKLKEMGANAWRCSHNPPTSEFLDACDQMGILVMDENRHLADTYDRKVGDGAGYVAKDLTDLEDMLLRDRNHPSIILWSLCNEEKNTGANTKLYEALKERAEEYDVTRPCTSAIIFAGGQGMEVATDVDGLNYSRKTYDQVHNRLPNKPILGSETGSARADRGIYFDEPPSDDPKANPPIYIRNYSTWYADKSNPESNENITQWAPVAQREWLAGTFYWTGFDYRGEPSPSHWPAVVSHFGIMDLCGFPKDNYYYYKAWWNKKNEPLVHVFPHWNWPGKEGQNLRVVVFSNCQEIELLLNGKSLGTQQMPPNRSVEWQVPYASGKLEAKGLNDGKLLASDIVETTGPPAAIELRTDIDHLRANDEDISVAEVSIVDAQGRVVPTASSDIAFSVSDGVTIAGVGNGDPANHESNVAAHCSAFNGHCAVLIRAANLPGTFVLTATSPGLAPATLGISVIK